MKGFWNFIKFFIGMNIFFALLELEFIPGLFVLFFVFTVLGNNKNKKKYTPSKTKEFKGKKLSQFNKNVKLYFESHDSIQITDDISITCEKTSGNTPYQLYVHHGEERICKIEEFSKYYPKTYMDLLEKAFEEVVPEEYETLTRSSKQKVEKELESPKKVSVKPSVKEEEKKIKKDSAEYFIQLIDNLNLDIKKEEITKDLFQTTAMLKQIKLIEEKYPDSKEKLGKLYQYYLPILVDILESYVKLMSSNAQHSEIDTVELKLRKTIVLVNEALKTITMQLCEDEIVDMKSDMSVLETILRKDGLVKDGTMFEEKSVK